MPLNGRKKILGKRGGPKQARHCRPGAGGWMCGGMVLWSDETYRISIQEHP